MDPNAALDEILNHVEDWNAGAHVDTGALVEAFEALDGWIQNGGFLPERWMKR